MVDQPPEVLELQKILAAQADPQAPWNREPAAVHGNPEHIAAYHAMRQDGVVEEAEPPANAGQATLPTCSHARTLAGFDGQRLSLVGTYCKSLTSIKMRGPRVFQGEAHIELEG